ncbi:MAG: TetR/AcrR family transcriptional regulator [Cupriavidus sp.]|nr:MAG: TetR/AcrR family transcriptional regulator [Cupriavidus sp.]
MPASPAARQRMIEAALDLFHRFGVNGTSVDQVLAQSGTGKSQFAHYFRNKDGLVRATVQFLDALVRSGKVESNYEIETWKDFERWLQSYIDFQESVNYERSCPFGTIGADLSNEQELIRQDICLFLEWSRSRMSRFFAERRAAGELAPSVQPDELADLCLSVMQGGMLLTKMARSPRMFEGAARQVNAYVKSLRLPAPKPVRLARVRQGA